MNQFRNRVALLIGVGNYKAEEVFRNVKSVESNIKELENVLADPELGDFEVIPLHNPTANEIRDKIEDVFDEYHNSLIFLYYCGHGFYKKVDRDSSVEVDSAEVEFYLTGRDSSKEYTSSLISGTDLKERYIKHPPKQLILILDCCHGELIANSFFSKAERLIFGKGGTQLSSSSEDVTSTNASLANSAIIKFADNLVNLKDSSVEKDLGRSVGEDEPRSFDSDFDSDNDSDVENTTQDPNPHNRRGIAVMTSSGREEKASGVSDHSDCSAFTHFLLEAIKTTSKEETIKEKWLTVEEVYEQIKKKFKEERQNANPYLCCWGAGSVLRIAKQITEDREIERNFSDISGVFVPGEERESEKRRLASISLLVARDRCASLGLTFEKVCTFLEKPLEDIISEEKKIEEDKALYLKALEEEDKASDEKAKKDLIGTREGYKKDVKSGRSETSFKQVQSWEREYYRKKIKSYIENTKNFLIGNIKFELAILIAGGLSIYFFQLYRQDSEAKTRLRELENLLATAQWSKCIEQAQNFPTNSFYIGGARHIERARDIRETCLTKLGIQSSPFFESEGFPVDGLSITPSTEEIILVRPRYPEIWQISSRNRLSSYAGFSNQSSRYFPQAIGFYQVSNIQSFDTLLVFANSSQLKLHNISDGTISDIPFDGNISPDLVVISRNGKVLVIVQGSIIRVFDISLDESQRQYVIRERQKSLTTSLLGAVSLALSSDGSIITIGGSTLSRNVQSTSLNEADSSQQGAIEVWDVEKGELIKEVVEYSSQITALSISTDGSRIASGSANGEIKIWDLPSLRANQSIKPIFTEGIQAEVRAIAISPTNNLIAVSSANKTQLFSIVEGSKPQELNTRAGLPQPTPIYSIAFTANGNALIGGGADGRLIIWQWSNNR